MHTIKLKVDKNGFGSLFIDDKEIRASEVQIQAIAGKISQAQITVLCENVDVEVVCSKLEMINLQHVGPITVTLSKPDGWPYG